MEAAPGRLALLVSAAAPQAPSSARLLRCRGSICPIHTNASTRIAALSSRVIPRNSSFLRSPVLKTLCCTNIPNCAISISDVSALQSSETLQDLSSVVLQVREALGVGNIPHQCLFKMTGTQELMGMNGRWEFFFSPSGKFSDAFIGADYASLLAFDGTCLWESDTSGRVSLLDLDDFEVSLLACWFKSGLWASATALDHLVIRSLDKSDWDYLDSMKLPASYSSSSFTFLAVSLKGNKVVMYLAINKATWLPHNAVMRAYGTAAFATLDNWVAVCPSNIFKLPMLSTSVRDSGDRVTTCVSNVELLRDIMDEQDPPFGKREPLACDSIFPRDHLFQTPSSRKLDSPLTNFPAASLSFEDKKTTEVQAYQTSSGHILVRPQINGLDVGFFILDTGASTLTIEPDVADKLGLRKFGCVHTVTVRGPTQCSFRQAESFTLGPLTISNPQFVDVAGAALADPTLPVAGICGFDIFHHCRIHLKRAQGRGMKSVRLNFSDPETSFDEEVLHSQGQRALWLPTRMLSLTPHITIRFQPDKLGDVFEAMFLVDTGAAGTDIIFNAAATEQYRLLPKGPSQGTGLMRGMGLSGAGSANAPAPKPMQVASRTLAKVWIGEGVSAQNAACTLVCGGEGNGLQLSAYTAGLICQNLFDDFDLVVDYKNCRIGVVTRTEQGASSRAQAAGA